MVALVNFVLLLTILWLWRDNPMFKVIVWGCNGSIRYRVFDDKDTAIIFAGRQASLEACAGIWVCSDYG